MHSPLRGQQDILKFVLILLSFPLQGFTAGHTRSLEKRTVAPIVVPASQYWDGNDGPWSSFTLQVGTPAQDVRVLISTASTQTWVIVPEGCTPSDPSNCATLRGEEFNLNQSSTWIPNIANLSTNLYYLGLESVLGYTGNGEYGFDTIALGWQGSSGPSLKNQTLAGIATKDFYLGLLGLNPRPSNFTTVNNPIPSYLENLKNKSLIPSISWSYTAGNQYRLNSVLGSLTLGGYDASKFVPSNMSFRFNEENIRDLTVVIEGITMANSTTNVSLLPTSIPAYVDSTVPHIWLPSDACTLFEKAFNLSYDNETELYLVKDSQHASLLYQNPNITFTFGNLTAGATVNITLPYAAFDLSVSYPIVSNTSRYFPLRRASNSSQYTLGRTFLQEAYIIADYERRNFSVSQCKWDADAQQDILSISSPESSHTSSETPAPPPPSTSSSYLSPGIILGITIGAVVGIIVTLVIIYILVFKPHFASDIRHELDGHETPKTLIYESDGSTMPPEIHGRQIRVQELPAREDVAAELGNPEPSELDWRNFRRKRIPGEMIEPEAQL